MLALEHLAGNHGAPTPLTSGTRPRSVEHRQRIERAGALRVVLDRLDRLGPMTQPLDRAVVEVRWLTRNPEASGSESPTTWTSWFCAVTWTVPVSRSWTGWLAP